MVSNLILLRGKSVEILKHLLKKSQYLFKILWYNKVNIKNEKKNGGFYYGKQNST